jgi:hypothetical protein
MGTKEEVREHEPNCCDNYGIKSCHTCKHKVFKNIKQYECALGKEIPEGKIFIFCGEHEREEKSNNSIGNIFGNLFDVFK